MRCRLRSGIDENMKIHLEELTHQREALDALLGAVPTGSTGFPTRDSCGLESPHSHLRVGKPARLSSALPNANPLLHGAGEERNFIDIKMETGTGKTYVYTRAMLELHQRFGLFKFVIVVPSLAIKEGTRNFIASDYARQHFSKSFPNKRIELQVLGEGDFAFKSGKRKNFPSALVQFCEADRNEKNTIQCLLVNTHILISKGFRDDTYDQTLFGGSSCPMEAVRNTRPVVIIDEPHRVKRDGAGYKAIQELAPQVIIRFGATFPTVKVGSGRNATEKPDYYRSLPQYNLGAVEAFNKDLVKGVSVQYPNLPGEENTVARFKVKNVSAKELVLVQVGTKKEYAIKVGEGLNVAGGGFSGITYEGGKKLSNDLELETGMELLEDVFSLSYQEILLSQALDAHFKTEVANFHREGYKVKTMALFFIDSIDSYRNPDGWLKTTFERLLKAKIEALLSEAEGGLSSPLAGWKIRTPVAPEYRDFLETTKANLALSHGGYFAKDNHWGEADDSAIADEVEDILHKERTLPFKKKDGTWNIRRFFFSKWTLREGWDNPNVFTICKLRTSGSETSKIQEVGRGLRLPVDEQGNRLANAEWKLNFIIGWDEKDFADNLIGEINRDAKVKRNTVKLTAEMIKVICDHRQLAEEALLNKLDDEGIITRTNDFKEGGYEKLIALYPELLQTQVKSGKVTSPTKPGRPKIKLRTENWQKIKAVWEEICKRYMLSFERIGEGEIADLFESVLTADGVFDDNKTVSVVIGETQKGADGEALSLTEKTVAISNVGLLGDMSYGMFVEQLAKRTAIPVSIIHGKLWNTLRRFADSGMDVGAVNAKLNQNSLEKIVEKWTERFAETYAAKYEYNPLDFTADTSVWQNGSFVNELEAGLVGNSAAHHVSDDPRNLYEKPLAYDSEIEYEVIKIEPPPRITVFGKIPRRAIKVPTYTGGTTTPDFMYCKEETVEYGTDRDARTGTGKLTLLVETKPTDVRLSEKRAVDAQEKLFRNIPDVHWKLLTSAQAVQEALGRL